MNDPSILRKQAHAIASSGKPSSTVLSELKHWASQNGPVAHKLAIIEFITLHGSSPEAVTLMPELMRTASHTNSPVERKELLLIANNLRSSFGGRSGALGMQSNRPSAQVQLPPRDPRSFISSGDIRDSHLRLRESLSTSLGAMLPEEPRFNPSKSPDSLQLSSHKAEQIMKHLIERMKSHSSDHQQISAPMEKVKNRKLRKKSSVKRSKKAKSKKKGRRK